LKDAELLQAKKGIEVGLLLEVDGKCSDRVGQGLDTRALE